MSSTWSLSDPHVFSEALFEKMKAVFPGVRELELYEFRYGLADLLPQNGWSAVQLESREQIEARLKQVDLEGQRALTSAKLYFTYGETHP